MHVTDKRKKKTKTENPNSSKLAIQSDHPHCQIEIQFSVVGGLWVIVLSFKFDQNRLSGYRDVRGQNLDYCVTLAIGLYNCLYDHTGLIEHSTGY